MPAGTVAGAVKTPGARLAVWSGLNEVVPHEAAGVQLQVTPPFAVSLATVAITLPVAPATRVVGDDEIVTVIGGLVAVMVIFTGALTMAGFVTEVAVMVT